MGIFNSFGSSGADHTEDISIDISPLANRVGDITNSLSKTQGAVAVMGEAIVQQERESAQQICEGVNYGFHALIQSQIGQKIAVHESNAQARLGLMKDIADKLDETRETLLKDYQNIKRRYVALFNGLDRDLKNRICALNKHAVQIAECKQKIVFATPTRQASAALCYARESQMYTQQFLGTELKKHTQVALNYLDGNMDEEVMYEESMAPVVYKKKIEDISEEFIPVVISESGSLHQQGSSMWDAKAPQSPYLFSAVEISRACIEEAKQNEWNEMTDEEKSRLKEAVYSLPEFSSMNSRVSQQLKKLMDESDWLTWRKGGV